MRLATDGADVVCLQELPVWALEQLGGWSGMTVIEDVAQRPRLGPLPSSARLGRAITQLDNGLFRSAFSGQANAILLRPDFRVLEHRSVALNPRSFRRVQARRLGLGPLAGLVWSKERRVCQAVRVLGDDLSFVVGNVHATSYPPDPRLADAELLRAAVFVDGFARPEEPVLLCGDFNVSTRTSRTLADLTSPEWGFEGATPTGIDHVLVRGVDAGPPLRWPPDRRARGGVLLSDHAPVEREVG